MSKGPVILPLEAPLAALRAAVQPTADERAARSSWRGATIPAEGIARSELLARRSAVLGRDLANRTILDAETAGDRMSIALLNEWAAAAGGRIELHFIPASRRRSA